MQKQKASKMTIAKIRVPRNIQMNPPTDDAVKCYIDQILNEKQNMVSLERGLTTQIHRESPTPDVPTKTKQQLRVHDSGISFIEINDRQIESLNIPTIRVVTYVGSRIQEKNKLPPAKVEGRNKPKRMKKSDRQIPGQSDIRRYLEPDVQIKEDEIEIQYKEEAKENNSKNTEISNDEETSRETRMELSITDEEEEIKTQNKENMCPEEVNEDSDKDKEKGNEKNNEGTSRGTDKHSSITEENVDKFTDQNHGSLRFVAFTATHDKKLKIFCWLDSGLSNVWMKLLKHREKTFGHGLAKSVLDSEQILSAKIINLVGDNIGRQEISHQKPQFSRFSLIEKYGIIKTLKAKLDPNVIKSKDFQNQPGSGLVQVHLPWEVQVGQVKVHVDADAVGTDEIFQIFLLLDHFSNQKGMVAWDFLDYVQLVDEQDDRIGRLSRQITEELQKCVDAQRNGNEYSPTMFSLNSRIRSNMPDVLNEADNVHILLNGQKVAWDDGSYEKCGADVRVIDIINAVVQTQSFKIDLFRIQFGNMNFTQSNQVHQFVDMICLEEGEPLMKIGKDFYMINPDYQHHLEVNIKFVAVLKEIFTDDNLIEPLPWNVKGEKQKSVEEDKKKQCGKSKENNKDKEKGKEKEKDKDNEKSKGKDNTKKRVASMPSFTISDLLKYCYTGEKELHTDEKQKLHEILTEDQHYLIKESNQMFRDRTMNCCLLECSDLVKNLPKVGLEKLSFILAQENKLSAENLGKLFNNKDKEKQEEKENKNEKEDEDETDKDKENEKEKDKQKCNNTSDDILKVLKGKSPVCETSKESEERLIVRNPYLSKHQVFEINNISGDNICFSMLIQFLRRHVPMDEGSYNELYHLSNCKCHYPDWTYLVLDRILMAGNIEICDVLAYNEEENTSYFLHVKKGADAEPARTVCSQVRVSIEEVVRTLIIDQDFNIFDQIWDVSTFKAERIHNLNLYALIQTKFASKEDFVGKMRKSKFNICMAIAETTMGGINEWGSMKDMEISKDLSHFLQAEILKIFQDVGCISKHRNHITHMMIDRSQEEIVDIIKEKYPKISKEKIQSGCRTIYKSLNVPPTREFLRNRFVTKCCINDLYDKFAGMRLTCDKVKLQIMRIQTL